MKIGYARTSTIEQNYSLEDQIERLESQGCEKIFSEKVSSVQSRPEFEKCIEFARKVMLLSSPSWIDSHEVSLTSGNTSPHLKRKVRTTNP